MNKQDILDQLRKNERTLRERGVVRTGLVGAWARGDNKPDSAIDIIIEVVPEVAMDYVKYIAVVHAIEALFTLPVDVSNLSLQKPPLRPEALGEAVYAF